MSETAQSSRNVPILDLQLKEFYQLVGQNIKAWATTEGLLFDICEKLLKTDRTLVSVVFFRSPTISSRLDLTNELLTVRFPKDHPVIVQWKPIKKAMSDLLPVRNSLAHDPVKMNIAQVTTFETSTSDKEKLRGKEQRQVREDELRQYLNKVDAVSASLGKFISEVLAQA